MGNRDNITKMTMHQIETAFSVREGVCSECGGEGIVIEDYEDQSVTRKCFCKLVEWAEKEGESLSDLERGN